MLASRQLPLLWAFALMYLTAGRVLGQTALDTRDSVARHLEHAEGLVHSAACQMELRVTPTASEAIPLIQEVSARTGKSPDRYLVTPGYVRRNSFTSKWLRSGPKERFERTF